MVPAENAPPMHPNCRCSTVPHMDMETYDRWLDSGAAKNGVDFGDFESLCTTGAGSVTFDTGYDTRSKQNAEEIAQAQWLADTFGGKVKLLTQSHSNPTPDYEWNKKYWDLKTPRSTNGSDKLVHHGIHQINNNPGGILVDCSNEKVNIEGVIEIARRRLHRSGKGRPIKIIIKKDDSVIAILK